MSNKPTAAKEQDNKPTIKQMLDAASTAADLNQIVERLSKEITDVSLVIADMNNRRPDVYISGENVDEFHDEIGRYQEHQKTLQTVHEQIWKQYLDKKRQEEETDLVNRVADVKAQHTGPLQSAWRKFYEALVTMERATAEVEEHTSAIEGMNGHLRHSERTELLIDLTAPRAAFLDSLQPSAEDKLAQMRMKEALALTPREGENEDTFNARYHSAYSSAISLQRTGDRFRRLGEKVLPLIISHAFQMEPHEAARNMRIITTRSYATHSGQAVNHLHSNDGRPITEGSALRRGDFASQSQPLVNIPIQTN